MYNKRILILEDQESLREMLAFNLRMEAYTVVSATSGLEAVELLKQEHFDLCLLDVMTPELDGFQVCEFIRLRHGNLPVIFLSARNTAQDRLTGLKLGADDYLAKPFHLEELLIKIQRLLETHERLNRSKKPETESLTLGKVQINLNSGQCQRDGELLRLTKKELELLRCLVRYEGELLSREKLYGLVWGFNIFPETRTLDNMIMTLRRKIEPVPTQPVFIEAFRGIGYRLNLQG